jgi:hypothetical protein
MRARHRRAEAACVFARRGFFDVFREGVFRDGRYRRSPDFDGVVGPSKAEAPPFPHVVDALLAASVEPAALGRVLDVGSGSLVSIRDAVSLIADVVGSGPAPAFGAIPDRSGDRDLLADPEPARRYLGWTARVDLRTGIPRTVAWHEKLVTSGLSAARPGASP